MLSSAWPRQSAADAPSKAKALPGSRSRSVTTITPAMRRSRERSAVPVQIGENFNGPKAMIEALAARACGLRHAGCGSHRRRERWIRPTQASLQRTASRCRRICCQRSARTFSPRARPATTWSMSTGPTRSSILEEPLQIQDGLARVPDRPGIGLTWRSEAVKALSLDR